MFPDSWNTHEYGSYERVGSSHINITITIVNVCMYFNYVSLHCYKYSGIVFDKKLIMKFFQVGDISLFGIKENFEE